MLATAQLIPLPYLDNSAHWFALIRHLPQAIWLDSSYPLSHYGRFDIISAAPSVKLETRGAETLISHSDGRGSSSTENPFALVQDYMVPSQPLEGIPFAGGALGYFAYDLGRRLEQLPEIALQDIELPDMSVGIYPWAIVQDHQQKIAWLVENKSLAPTYNFLEIQQMLRFHELNVNSELSNFSFSINGFESNLNAKKYADAIAHIQTYIEAGDCYQVNFAQRFSSLFTGDPLAAYLHLRTALPSPFSAFMQLDQGAVLSLSPERFIQIQGTRVETKPIKGTIARGATAAEDQDNAQRLLTSSKDRSENLMIVDLLRNDLSKTCTHIQVPELFSLQSFANVHHLVSTITGELKPGTRALDVLASSFPGGSITGAPKIRAMEIIEELEETRRSLYCGSIGYISSCGNMDTNIAIRTLVCDTDRIHCWGGGGIVADSNTEQEYQETFAKVKVLLDALENKFAAGS